MKPASLQRATQSKDATKEVQQMRTYFETDNALINEFVALTEWKKALKPEEPVNMRLYEHYELIKDLIRFKCSLYPEFAEVLKNRGVAIC